MLPSYNLPYYVRWEIVAPVLKYRWTNTGNSCHYCRGMEGVILSMDEWAGATHPPAHNHCDCKLVAVYEEPTLVSVIVYAPQPFQITDILSGKYFENNTLHMCINPLYPMAVAPNQGIFYTNTTGPGSSYVDNSKGLFDQLAVYAEQQAQIWQHYASFLTPGRVTEDPFHFMIQPKTTHHDPFSVPGGDSTRDEAQAWKKVYGDW